MLYDNDERARRRYEGPSEVELTGQAVGVAASALSGHVGTLGLAFGTFFTAPLATILSLGILLAGWVFGLWLGIETPVTTFGDFAWNVGFVIVFTGFWGGVMLAGFMQLGALLYEGEMWLVHKAGIFRVPFVLLSIGTPSILIALWTNNHGFGGKVYWIVTIFLGIVQLTTILFRKNNNPYDGLYTWWGGKAAPEVV